MRSHRRRLLLLDANPVRAPIARALEKAGFAVLVATEVAEALEIAANRALEAVIASAELPGIHALDLVASLRGVDAVRPDSQPTVRGPGLGSLLQGAEGSRDLVRPPWKTSASGKNAYQPNQKATWPPTRGSVRPV